MVRIGKIKIMDNYLKFYTMLIKLKNKYNMKKYKKNSLRDFKNGIFEKKINR